MGEERIETIENRRVMFGNGERDYSVELFCRYDAKPLMPHGGCRSHGLDDIDQNRCDT